MGKITLSFKGVVLNRAECGFILLIIHKNKNKSLFCRQSRLAVDPKKKWDSRGRNILKRSLRLVLFVHTAVSLFEYGCFLGVILRLKVCFVCVYRSLIICVWLFFRGYILRFVLFVHTSVYLCMAVF